MAGLSIRIESPPDDTLKNTHGKIAVPPLITEYSTIQINKTQPSEVDIIPEKTEPETLSKKEEIKQPPPDPPEETIITNYTYKQIETKFQKNYIDRETNNSTICDIIAMYLKGQKILYAEAKTVCEQRLNYLMLPAIFITAVCTILSLVIKDYQHGPTIVSSLNGFTAFILSLINYLKLDAKAEAHRTSAYKFDKLQSTMEFNSGRILFDEKASKDLIQMIQNVETNVKEIKETNQFILPEKIRYTYPNLYNMNVFAEVKKVGIREMLAMSKLTNIMNESLHIQNKYIDTPEQAMKLYDVKRLDELDKIQKDCIETIIKLKNDYLKIDEAFELEMRKHRESATSRLDCCAWLKS
jgi:hypothetical protein